MSAKSATYFLLKVLMLGSALVLGSPSPSGAGQSSGPATDRGDQPPQTGPKIVEEGLFPKSIRIPGTDLSLGIGGYVKVDFIQDLDAIGDAYEFKVNSIPAAGTSAAAQSGRTTIHARETRLNLDLRSEGSGGNQFRAFVEGDFFGDGNAFRMRHAFGEFGPILGGQTWSTFQDITARGLTVDFEGPDGEVFVRQPMIRFTHKVGSTWTMAVAVENPTPQFAVPTELTGSARAMMPDIPGFVRYQRGAGHVQVAGLVRQVRFDSTASGVEDTSTVGLGLNTTFVLPLRPGYQLLGQFVIGDGTARYIEGLGGQNLDAVLASTGSIQNIRTQAGNLSYIHKWSTTVKSGLAISTSFVDDNGSLPSTAIERLMDVRANVIWTPYRLVDVGGEVLWGERRNQNGTSGEAWRVQFAIIYRLS